MAAAARPLPRLPTRERILRAAVYLFQSQGYHGTGVAEILESARAPKGCFYHHFPGGKEALAVATIEWLRGEVDLFLELMMQDGAGGREMALAIADKAAEGLKHREQMRGSLISVLAQEAVPQSATIAAALKAAVEGWVEKLAAGFASENHGNATLAAATALAAIEGATTLARVAGQPKLVTELTAAVLDEASADPIPQN